MARAYTVGTAALALDVSTKWLDNVLSHHQVPGVVQERQGVSRKVGFEGVLRLALGLSLIEDLEVPTAIALRLADRLAEADGRHTTKIGIDICLNLPELRSRLDVRLAHAVEIAAVPRRGRPPHHHSSPSNKTGRLD